MLADLSVSYTASPEDVFEAARKRLKAGGIPSRELQFELYRQAVDPRKKLDIRLVNTVLVTQKDGTAPNVPSRLFQRLHASLLCERDVPAPTGKRTGKRPLVVGTGPAGMFAALYLAEAGYRPLVLERGEAVEERERTVQTFLSSRTLDTESNIQFGAGGAGTFSDGKLMTRIRDEYTGYVLRRLAEFGAPQEILYRAHPHIGTDCLRRVVSALLARVEEAGGEILYRTRFEGMELENEKEGAARVRTSRGLLECGPVVLAVGNSARDTFRTLLVRDSFSLIPKPMSFGVRVEHRREDIDRMLYGDAAGHPALGAAEYHLSDTTGPRGVYTFCMCPGGTVVAGASEEGGLVVNGMSRHSRDGVNSNAAVAVSLTPADYPEEDGSAVLGAIALQRQTERLAYEAGGADWAAPVQTMKDFLDGTSGHSPREVRPTYMDGYVRPADLGSLLPYGIGEDLRRGLRSFDRTMPGYAMPGAVLTGVETRTSSPVRILRGEDRTCPGHPLVYPCGEGAGYAGGITSSAVDGLRSAIEIGGRFRPSVSD